MSARITEKRINEMNIAIRYYTRSGNTAKLAGAIADRLALSAETIEKPLEDRVDILLLGCSYYAFDMDEQVKEFLRSNKDKIGKIACFGTSAMMKSMKKPMRKVTDELGIEVLDSEFHCRGSFGPAHKGRPNEKDMAAAAQFAANLAAKAGCSEEV